MRRLILAAAITASLLVLPGTVPANAAPNRSADATSQAFWTTQHWLDADTYRLSTWYVGVFQYQDRHGTFYYSDLYREVDTCNVVGSRTRCHQTSFAYGDSGIDKRGESFTIDSDGLTTANVHARYWLQRYDQAGNPLGHPVRHVVDATWTGRGDLTRSHQKESFHQGCTHYTTTIKGQFRRATATGTLDGSDLGTTRVAFLATDASLSVDHRC